MIRKNHIVKINFPGGIVPSGDLLLVAKAALPAGVRDIRFGGRQQLLMEVSSDKLTQLHAGLAETTLKVEVDADVYPNIMSSCVAEQMMHSSGWLREGVYKDVLDAFDLLEYRPGIPVNLIDQGQNLVPAGTGRLNFIASGMGNYWHLLLRVSPYGRLHEWKSLVYSGNIPRLARRLENFLATGVPGVSSEMEFVGRMYAEIMQSEQWMEQLPPEQMSFPDFALPYYEGFNRHGERLWLGIYRRDELFPVTFLADLCMLCLQTKVAQLYLSPWKSIVIQGIEPGNRKGWDIILGRHGINVRHSLCELSWQVEDLSTEGLALKHYLVRQFDRDDVRTFGLCFAIRLEEGTDLFGLVLIRRQPSKNSSQRRALDRYDILYRKDFDARSDEWILFRKDMEKEHLSTYLKSLCKYFYECKAGEEMILHHVYRHRESSFLPADRPGREAQSFKCVHCLTVYNPLFGDPEAQVPPGTAFDTLTEYTCPVCGSNKPAFRPFADDAVLADETYKNKR